MAEQLRLIVDTDVGVDDAQAIMLALSHPNTRVEAITAVTGNVFVDLVCGNIAVLLDAMGADVPFYRGAELPLMGEWDAEDPAVHGTDGMGDWPQRPTSNRQPEAEHAVLALLRLVNESPGEYTLVTLGPLTNIALALRIDPAFARKIKRWVCMGGTHEGRGNTTRPAAEWNIFVDPEAAAIAFANFPDCTLVSWEATIANPIPIETLDRLIGMDTPRGRFFAGITASTHDFHHTVRGATGFLIPDPLAMAVALDPSLITGSFRAHVAAEVSGRYTRGHTVIDHDSKLKQPENATIVTQINMDGVAALYERALQGG